MPQSKNGNTILSQAEILRIIKGYASEGADHIQLSTLYESLSMSQPLNTNTKETNKEERSKEENLTTKDKTKTIFSPDEEKIRNQILKIIAGERDNNINTTYELKKFVDFMEGTFTLNDCYVALEVKDAKGKASIRKAIERLCQNKQLEKIGVKGGTYRRPDTSYEVIDLDDDIPDPLKVVLPLRLDQFCNIYNGMTILAEGEKSSGKSAFGIEAAWLNRNLFPGKVRYMQNGELNKQMLQIRLRMRPQDLYPVKKFGERIEFITRHKDWWDIIDPEGLNIVDYIEEHEKKYLIPDYISKIQARLTTGLAIIILQRVPGRDYGTGGAEIRNKPSVICSLKRDGKINTIHIEDIKSFNTETIGKMFDGEVFNPRGLWREYKLVDGWKFLPQGEWRTKGDDKKYDYFKKGKEDADFPRED